MSALDESHKSMRYKLGELLRDSCDHLLLLTATPHKGDPANFSLFLQLLDADAYADTSSIREAMDRRKAPFYLRGTKEAMVYFPELGEDGAWVARKIFTKRIPRTVDFQIDGAEFELYRDVTRFVKRESARAAAQGEDPRARAIGFLMSLYQRRLASSAYAMQHSLQNRARRLEEGLKSAQKMSALAPSHLPDSEEIEEMEESERERLEAIVEAVTLTRNAEQIRAEVQELRRLAEQAHAVQESGSEIKLSRLKALLEKQGFFDNPDQRLLVFTEFKDTLDYLVERLRSWGFQVGFIHGGMKPGSRDEPGTRLFAEQQFREGQVQILVATEAAGEGINLQVCNIMFNYDIPWNPNRLEQRMGRIHRYGQRKDCLIFNFVATNTIEGRVLQRLLERLQEIRDALDDDAVFNVVGEILPAAHVERVLRDYYAGRLGEADLEERLLRDVDEGQFRAICQNALEGLASKRLNLEMLIERRARAQERRVVPETIARFLLEAADTVPLTLKSIPSLPHTFEPSRTPIALRRHEKDADWKLPALSDRYPRCSTDRDTAETHHLEWVTPGHPLFEAVRRHTYTSAHTSLTAGAAFYSLQHEQPARIDFYRARVVDGLGHVIHERLFAVETSEDGEAKLREPNVLGDFTAGHPPSELPAVASIPEPTMWLNHHVLEAFLYEVRAEAISVPAMELLMRALRAEYQEINFERILHAVEALQAFAAPQTYDEALSAIKPILSAFAEPSRRSLPLFNFQLLRALREDIITSIALDVATKTNSSLSNLNLTTIWQAFRRIFLTLRGNYVVNCFTLNYDTSVDSVAPWHSGYLDSSPGKPSSFSRRRFDQSLRTRNHTLAHLHGCVLFGYKKGTPTLVHFSNVDEAVASYSIANVAKPDVTGELYESGPIISGLRKFDKLISTPYGFYYNAFINALLTCPRLLIIGYGFNDPHINYWLAQHRVVHAEKRRVAVVSLENL